MQLKAQKKRIRTKMLEQRSCLSLEYKTSYDQQVCEGLWKLIALKNHQTIHTYLPMGSEINIFPLIRKLLADRRKVIVPKTLSKGVLMHLELDSIEALEPGEFGTQHPRKGSVYLGSYDLIIVPGLAFDQHKNRLGYGGGYYDNFLVRQPTAKKIGIFYPFQNVNELPTESHDVRLNEVLVFPAS